MRYRVNERVSLISCHYMNVLFNEWRQRRWHTLELCLQDDFVFAHRHFIRAVCSAWFDVSQLFFFFLHLFCFYTQTCLPTWCHVIISIEATLGDETRWWWVHACVSFCNTMHGVAYKCAQNTIELSVHYISSALFAAESKKRRRWQPAKKWAAAATRKPFFRSAFLCPFHFHKYVKLFER